MTTNFKPFGQQVSNRLANITKNARGAVFVTTADPDALWDTYIGAFPEGTNPIFRERTEHDCSCCRNFVKHLGGVVTLLPDGAYRTVWDVEAAEPYGTVSRTMAAFIREHPIAGVFRTAETGYGAETTYEDVPGNPSISWNHFHGNTPDGCRTTTPGAAIGNLKTLHDVFQRGLDGLSADSLELVNDLIGSNSLYRGEEHGPAVSEFLGTKSVYDRAEGAAKTNFAWIHLFSPAARFRNTVIGTLAVDLSDGMEVERAVRAFETKVAPSNYRRTSAPITKGMVDKAVAKVRELGLESALRRRHARISDVSVNDVLFVDRSVRPAMKDNLADLLMGEVTSRKTRQHKGGTDITAEEFLSAVLPGATGLQLELTRQHLGNFMSITAPAEDDAGRLFQWDNGFAWVYDGDVADSIKERVKKAGGNVEAWLRVSLSWFNTDDLDIHCQTPTGFHIFYGNKAKILDVDMNVGGESREPVENLAFDQNAIRVYGDGIYRIWVNQFRKREGVDTGFEIEYEHNGRTIHAAYDKAVRQGESVQVLELEVRRGEVVAVRFGIPADGGSSKPAEKWGVTTGLVQVDSVMLSPNYWNEDGRGNKHHLFILRGCKNPAPVRGFFNEFLRPDLHEHRKVFEVLGSKTMCQPTDEQLSGVGFSSTKRNTATFVVDSDGATRTYNVQF